ncbi:YciI family protein [Agromyces sp. Soil535]|uniref:YciI family protein n=1 Tax=Agromyces sp. Soil535 TaxID=1736390 RepID=UPI0009E7F9E7|nr:YciI family protein [Agromyces sp. Soil535]
MRYMMFVATDPEAEPFVPEEDGIAEWIADVEARGVHVLGERLRPLEDATLVRVRGGELLVTDGPFTESKEWIAGFDVLDCRDLDEAIEIASRHPMARFGRIELRPMWPLDLEEDPVAREEREAGDRGRRREPAVGA